MREESGNGCEISPDSFWGLWLLCKYQSCENAADSFSCSPLPGPRQAVPPAVAAEMLCSCCILALSHSAVLLSSYLCVRDSFLSRNDSLSMTWGGRWWSPRPSGTSEAQRLWATCPSHRAVEGHCRFHTGESPAFSPLPAPASGPPRVPLTKRRMFSFEAHLELRSN